jgi:ABC-type Fe2+-enterobactin transport system substrate-binding protein
MNALKRGMVGSLAGLMIAGAAFGKTNVTPRPERTPDGALVVLDVVPVRVMGAAVTLLGGVLFVATLPVTAFSGMDTAWNALVADPFYFTFLRPIGEFDDWQQRASTVSEIAAEPTPPPAP